MRMGLQVYIQKSDEAALFYQKAFGATLGYHVKNPDGTFFHAELYLDGQPMLALSESRSDIGAKNSKGYTPTDYPIMNFGINLDSEEAVKRAYAVLIEDGDILLPLGSLPWSACCANVIDKYGVFWYISI